MNLVAVDLYAQTKNALGCKLGYNNGGVCKDDLAILEEHSNYDHNKNRNVKKLFKYTDTFFADSVAHNYADGSFWIEGLKGAGAGTIIGRFNPGALADAVRDGIPMANPPQDTITTAMDGTITISYDGGRQGTITIKPTGEINIVLFPGPQADALREYLKKISQLSFAPNFFGQDNSMQDNQHEPKKRIKAPDQHSQQPGVIE
ncbi:MAG: hypothetical protein K1X44_02020 [Alphaproteobacteria bacterium]|nr:hypothetical protein [Alphaproteobacteria bacterium]